MTRKPYYQNDSGDLILDPDERHYVLKFRDLPLEDKPREKLMQYGPTSLSTAELLAIILGVGTKKEDVLAMSQRLLKEYGENIVMNQKDPRMLAGLLDVPIAKACQIIACFELGKRFFAPPGRGKPVIIRTPSQVYEYLKDMRDLPKEHLRGLYLDSHYQLLHDEVISIGSVTSNIVHPREVFRPALEHVASAVILAHNHPSNIAKSSDADIAITKQIVDAGKILGITLLDHVIVTKNSFESVPADY